VRATEEGECHCDLELEEDKKESRRQQVQRWREHTGSWRGTQSFWEEENPHEWGNISTDQTYKK
jgi:hypothetical protein